MLKALTRNTIAAAFIMMSAQAMASQEFSWGISIHGNLKCYSSEHGFPIKGAYPVEPEYCGEITAFWHQGRCMPFVKGDSNKTDFSKRKPVDSFYCK